MFGAVACGGGGGGGAGLLVDTSEPATASAFCERMTEIDTAAAMQCYGGTAADWSSFFASAMCDTLDQAVANHRVTYDRSKATACLDEMVRPFACSSSKWPDGASCVKSVLVPAAAVGDPCDTAYVCPADSACWYSPGVFDSCSVQTCQPVAVPGATCDSWCSTELTCVANHCVANLKLGDRCGGADQALCANGLYCALSSPTPTCQRRVDGGSCQHDYECFDYQYCDSTHHGHAPGGVGADCSSGPSVCGTFTACDPATHLCVAASHVGQLCGNIVGVPAECFGGICQMDAHQIYHCVSPAADEAACANDYECSSGFCSNGKCAAAPPNDGDACTDDWMCTSGFCGAGVCAARSPDGADCTVSNECQSGSCAAGKCAPQAENGADCVESNNCQSGHCAGGKCAACSI
jgi:hypothetical protein